MVKIRLMRMGRRNRAFFRIVVTDQRTKRDGKYIECLGWYDPLVRDFDKGVNLNLERLAYWRSVGAQASPTVKSFARRKGFRPSARSAAGAKKA